MYLIKQIINCPNPRIEGFYAFHEEIEHAREEIGPNFFVRQ